jgi:hypothetical protein
MADDMLRIANCSGFFGDRLSAAREMVEGGPIDVLTGDYLAELTMALLWRNRMKDPTGGYASTFLRQMEQVMGTCLDRGIKVVVNAGGLNPAGCADQLRALADRLGLQPVVAHIEGDDLLPRLGELQSAGLPFANLDTGRVLADAPVTPVTANAYLGGWGIAEALSEGADIVVTGRVTDAALVIGPSAWRFGWARDDWDALAGALVAGHVIECGAQTTGGNYSFFHEVPGLDHVGFPLVEMAADGSFVVTKHPGTGGLVSVGTVTAQLLYEIGGPRYLNPDVVARFDTIRLSDEGPDRVRVDGVRGEPAPDTTKVALNYLGGFRNSTTFVLTGLDIDDKARLVEEALWAAVGGRDQYAEADVQLIRSDRRDPSTNEEASAFLRITVKDPDQSKVGKAFSRAGVELALASYPGFHLTAPPGDATPYAVYWPTTVPNEVITQTVSIGGTGFEVAASPSGPPPAGGITEQDVPPPPGGPTVAAPLGSILGARSGDKGGNANLGLWARSDEAFSWLAATITVERLRRLLPETADLAIDRHVLANIRSVNFVIHGLLGEGVSSSTRPDPQAKSLGEWLRARVVDIPASLLEG